MYTKNITLYHILNPVYVMIKKCISLILIITLLLLSFFSNAQHAYIDSVEKRLSDVQDPRQRVLMQINLTKAYRNINPYKGLDYADTAMQLALKLGDRSLHARIINEKGVSYRKVDMYEQALKQHQRALTIFEDLGDKMGIAFALANIANVYHALEQYQKALDYHRQSLTIKRALDNREQLAYSLRTTALTLQALKEHDKAEKMMLEALELSKQVNDFHSVGNLYFHLGNNASEAGRKKNEAMQYYEKALEIYEQLESTYGTAISTYQKAMAHLDMGQEQLAFELLNKALEIAQRSGFRKITMDIYHALSNWYKKRENYTEAFRYLELYVDLHDEIFTETSNRNIAEMQAKYDNNRQRAQIEILEKERKLDTANQMLLILAIIFISSFGILIYWRYHEKKSTNRRLEKEIEQRRKQEKKLLQSEKMLKTANATKDKFFSIISHDLKSPFGAILGLSDMLDNEYDAFSDDEKREIVSEIRKATDNTYSLLQDLLAWSQSQRGVIEFNPSETSVVEVCRENVNFIEPAARKKDIAVNCGIGNNMAVFADKNMLTTILRNLLSNAVKFTPRGGKIDLTASMTNGKSNTSPFVEIVISDTGIGISPEMQSKLFRIEEKFKTTGTDKESGTGLGLLICKEFVEKHGGTIRVESREGDGSAFKFTLPAAGGETGNEKPGV